MIYILYYAPIVFNDFSFEVSSMNYIWFLLLKYFKSLVRVH